MTEVVFLASVQGYQAEREREVVSRLKAERPDLTVRSLSPEESQSVLAKFKLRFGPAVIIDNRLEFVGVPRYRMLLERIEISKQRALAPRPPPVPAAATASSPATPPAPKPAPPAPATSPGPSA